MTDVVALARRIATGAHAGQVDKAGEPYIGHPARVAGRLVADGRSDAVVAAGWLHDVVEDTDVTLDALREAGVPERVRVIVDALTRRDGEAPAEYYTRIRAAGGDAVTAKLADVADNADPDRLARLDEETRRRLGRKYATARDHLRGAAGCGAAPVSRGTTSP